MRRYRRGLPASDARLEALGALLEWAYGYRAAPSGGAHRRRAPSAGALYPTEVFAVAQLGGRWDVVYYDFAEHRFLLTGNASAARIAAELGLRAGEVGVLLVSVLWRSAQRYGARCYRYCLLDAGHVVDNLVRAGARFGCAVAGAPTPARERQLDLRDAEALVCALRVRVDAPAVPTPPALAAVPLDAFAGVQSPVLSPVVRRVVSFHRRTLLAPGGDLPLAWLAQPDPELERRADERHSAAGFTGAPLPHGRLALLHAAAERAARECGLHARAVELHDPALAAAFADACQRQQIVAAASSLVVVAAPVEALQAAYRETVLAAGLVCAELYRESSRLGAGTTTIGAFSEELVSRLSGLSGSHPVVVQAFGVEDPSARKADAARRVAAPVLRLRAGVEP
jgi:hypothetical protein